MDERKEDLKLRIEKSVPEYIKDNLYKLPSKFTVDEVDHLIQVGQGILLDKYDIVPGGGFVEEFNSNSLKGAFGQADDVVQRGMFLFVLMDYNINLYK